MKKPVKPWAPYLDTPALGWSHSWSLLAGKSHHWYDHYKPHNWHLYNRGNGCIQNFHMPIDLSLQYIWKYRNKGNCNHVWVSCPLNRVFFNCPRTKKKNELWPPRAASFQQWRGTVEKKTLVFKLTINLCHFWSRPIDSKLINQLTVNNSILHAKSTFTSFPPNLFTFFF